MAMAMRGLGPRLFLIAVLMAATGAHAEAPAAIAVPDATAVVTLHAEGAQLYECKAGSDGKLAWTFREPIATLMLDGKTVGRHYAGPTWEYLDASAVTAKAAGSSPGTTANDVAWLRLDAVGHRGTGVLSDVTNVQRINTAGGALSGACERTGAFRSVPYSADYVFLRKP
jgi:Protein of unknown function (DUF3455)